MNIHFLLIGLLSVSVAAHAAPPTHPPGLLPADIARPLLEQDLVVAAARAGMGLASQEADILDKSPYEWIARAAGQQRRVADGSRFKEWNVGVEQTIRLPAKAIADRNLGQATIDESHARYAEALHESARDLIALWVDWLAAERARELADGSLQSTQASIAAVEKRVRAGDASKLDLSIARAELAEQRRLENDAKTQVVVTWSRLSTRFPGVKRQLLALPVALPIEEKDAFWRDRMLAESDQLKIAQTKVRMAQAQAERLGAEKTPDPTLGVYTASEGGNGERITGIMISIPIPGSVRATRSAKALAAVEVSRLEVELKKRQLEAEMASAVATAQGAYDSLQIANEGVVATQESSGLTQRAYALGEADLQTLLLSRRQSTAAMHAALQAQVTALKTYYGLLVDAHLIWNLDHK